MIFFLEKLETCTSSCEFYEKKREKMGGRRGRGILYCNKERGEGAKTWNLPSHCYICLSWAIFKRKGMGKVVSSRIRRKRSRRRVFYISCFQRPEIIKRSKSCFLNRCVVLDSQRQSHHAPATLELLFKAVIGSNILLDLVGTREEERKRSLYTHKWSKAATIHQTEFIGFQNQKKRTKSMPLRPRLFLVNSRHSFFVV